LFSKKRQNYEPGSYLIPEFLQINNLFKTSRAVEPAVLRYKKAEGIKPGVATYKSLLDSKGPDIQTLWDMDNSIANLRINSKY
jgi:hypothetical protein